MVSLVAFSISLVIPDEHFSAGAVLPAILAMVTPAKRLLSGLVQFRVIFSSPIIAVASLISPKSSFRIVPS